MKSLALVAVVISLGLTIGISDAEAAKRLGSGTSSGMQRQMTPPAKATDAAPAARQAVPANAAAAPAAAAQSGRSWMGPIAGLAAGIGLAALASHFGFGEQLASFMMMALIAVAAIAAIGYVMRKRLASSQPAYAGAGVGANAPRTGLQYVENPIQVARSMQGDLAVASPATAPAASGTAANIPADFDVAGFERNAKVNFIRLQAANDAGNLDDIREFTTPEMFAEIKLSIAERAGKYQVTDVVSIDAKVIDVAEEATRYVVSVRFTGRIKEDDGTPEVVDEIWHLVKPSAGSGGWVLAGIQQIQ